jgi:acyl dehydratase
MRGLYWEQWEIGAEYESPGRTVTEADIVAFAGLSGDYNPLHVDEEHCKQTIFGTRIAHGLRPAGARRPVPTRSMRGA